MSGEKLQKVLARAGLGSRRAMETWIEAGRVRVDGERAALGERVSPKARISVDGRVIPVRATAPARRRVIAYHKPEGEVTTRTDPQGRPTVFRNLPRLRNGRWISIGRLDVNSGGLLLFTNDGELAAALMHPRAEAPRDYAVRVFGEVDAGVLERLTQGVQLADGAARFESVTPLPGGDGANTWYRVRLREGRHREVRRLWDAEGVTVSRLMRVQFASVALPPGLRRGQYRELPDQAVAALLQDAGMTPTSGAGPRRARHGRRRR